MTQVVMVKHNFRVDLLHMETSGRNRYGFHVGSIGLEYIRAGNLAVKAWNSNPDKGCNRQSPNTYYLSRYGFQFRSKSDLN
jgi:hypothetical protein